MVNLSKNFGTPTNKPTGLNQFAYLKERLKNDDVFFFKFQNRGWLVLKKLDNGTYVNYLYATKSQDKNVVKQVKV